MNSLCFSKETSLVPLTYDFLEKSLTFGDDDTAKIDKLVVKANDNLSELVVSVVFEITGQQQSSMNKRMMIGQQQLRVRKRMMMMTIRKYEIIFIYQHHQSKCIQEKNKHILCSI